MRKIATALTGLLMIGSASTAQAQTYPDRPIRLIVSIAAGSVTDGPAEVRFIDSAGRSVELHGYEHRVGDDPSAPTG